MLKKIEDLKKDLEALEKERIKAEGAFEKAMEGLKELGYSTVDEATNSLERITDDLNKANAEAADFIERTQKKYADHIE